MSEIQLERPVLATESALESLRALQRVTLGDPEVCVAVLDGPVDVSHPCFRGGDLRRLDTLVQDPAGVGAMSAHGTHVTSVIFGQPQSPLLGIAPRCRGLLVPVFRDDQQDYLSQLDLSRAIEQAVQEGAHIINISGGERAPRGEPQPMLARALQFCSDNNVLVVAAAGNDGCDCLHVPAGVASSLAVGAMTAAGEPLESSNWGETYRSNGVLAPGEEIPGAVPGGGIAPLTGSSFATPIVAGLAALLLTIQRRNGEPMNPQAVRKAILDSALPCYPREALECAPYLAGTLNVPGAYDLTTRGGTTTVPDLAAGPIPSQAAEAVRQAVAGAGVAPSAAPSSAEHGGQAVGATGQPTDATGHAVQGPSLASDVASAPLGGAVTPAAAEAPGALAPPASQAGARDTAQAVSASAPPGGTVAGAPPPTRATLGGVRPSTDCNCHPGPASKIFAIGNIDTDFGSLAIKDSFQINMPEVEGGGSPPLTIAANPYDPRQLADYLDALPHESTRLTWTLNLDKTPIYAIEARDSYPEVVYQPLRDALRNQSLAPDDPNFISRVSIPGLLTTRTTCLYSGQRVPVVEVPPSYALFTWNEQAVVDEVIRVVSSHQPKADTAFVRMTVRNFLDKVYYELRNLGQTSPDRALNFAATNVFSLTSDLAKGILSGETIPTSDTPSLYTLDTITVSKSPYERVDSDCWDVKVQFFSPVNDRAARAVYQMTMDVSELVPVQIAPTHTFLVAV